MTKGFYFKLASSNRKKNSKVYIPYLFACVFTIMMFYMMCAISKNPGLELMPGAGSLKSILGFGTTVIGIFAVIVLFYTNRFLMKRRQKELGLLNILGMDKGNIGKMLFWETVQVMGISIACGLAAGILLNKLMFAFLLKILFFEVPFGFSVSVSSIAIVCILFGGINVLIFLNNIRQIHLTNPVELLKGGQVGEREPKTKWLMAAIGVVCLGIGYYIAITTTRPLDAISMFFVAVLLVIIGTYALFTAGSVAFLKLLKKNKRFFYRTKHFISISGMIYRMKQNAVGLANICILSTGVLVMLSTTVSLYVGRLNLLETRYPNEVVITNYSSTEESKKQIDSMVNSNLSKYQLEKKDGYQLHSRSFPASMKDGAFYFSDEQNTDYTAADISSLGLISLEEYNRITGENISLHSDEVLFFTNSRKGYQNDTVTLEQKTYRIKQELDTIFMAKKEEAPIVEECIIVMPDQDQILSLVKISGRSNDQNIESLDYVWAFDLKGNKENIKAFEEESMNQLAELFENSDESYAYLEGRTASEMEFYSLYGSLFFIGIFLGALFLMATVLIIYYKQISEGYEDKERFTIMQKVGMSKKEVRNSIRSQVLQVFFLPLLMAVIHIAAAFRLIERLLLVLNLRNTSLFAMCTLGVIVVFAVIYGAIYLLTARVYYRIVE